MFDLIPSATFAVRVCGEKLITSSSTEPLSICRPRNEPEDNRVRRNPSAVLRRETVKTDERDSHCVLLGKDGHEDAGGEI